jgi:hypothetical protein
MKGFSMSLATEIQTAKSKATEAWAEVVHAAAKGSEPSLPALSKLADALGLTTHEAVAKLQADTDLVRQCHWYASQRDAAQARADAMLEPYSGSEREFLAAVESAEANARKLRETYTALNRQTMVAVGTAEGTRRRIEGSRPDLFPTPTVNG